MRDRNKFGGAYGAAGGREFTSRGKGAARNSFGHVGRESGDGVEFGSFGLKGRDRALEGAGVRVTRGMEQGAGVGRLDDTAGIHHLDPVAEAGDDAEIVGNKHDGHAEFLLHFPDELKNLRLHGDVEGGGGFIRDEDLGFGDERHRDHHALAHPAGELVGIIVDAFGRVVDPDGVKHRERPGERIAPGDFFVDEQRFDELLADAQVGVERGHRILENHGNAFAANRAGLGGRAVEEVDAVEHRGAADDTARGLRDEAHDRITRHGFTRARFAHDPEGLAALDAEADAVDGAVNAVSCVEISAEIVDGEEGHAGEKWGELRAESNRLNRAR